MFARATIRLGMGPHSSYYYYYLRQGGYVIVVFVCLSVNNFVQKLLKAFA